MKNQFVVLGMVWLFVFIILAGCDEMPASDIVGMVTEPSSEEVVEPVEIVIPKFNSQELESMYLTLPDFRESFLENNGDVEPGLYRVELSGTFFQGLSNIRIEKDDVVNSDLKFGYVKLNYGNVKNQNCNRIWVRDELVFYLRSPDFNVEMEGETTIYNFDVEIVGSRISRGGGEEETEGDSEPFSWEIPLSSSQEEDCF